MTLLASLAIVLQSILRVAFVGDPQADGSEQVIYNQRSIFKELRSRKDLDLVIVLGDIVNDDVSLLDPSIASLDSLPVPWFAVPGNHDRDSASEKPRGLATWRKRIGYIDTSFVIKGVRFVLMNNVRTKGLRDYEGGFSESQKQWLDSIVRHSAKTKRIVLVTHIPLSESKGQDSLMNILAPVSDKTTLFCGHTHTVRRHKLECGIEENICGAACGSWWRGVKDSNGLPYALMRCGAPRGYYIADFKGKGYSLDYKPVMREDRASATIVDSSSHTVAINIFGGSEEGSVEYRPYGSHRWIKASRSKRTAPEVIEVAEWNNSKTKEYRHTHKEEFIPMLLRPSSHLWEVIDSTASPGTEVRIRYKDGQMRRKMRVKLKRE